MNIQIPNLSLVVLIGPSGSGKSTFAKKHFLPTETVSSDNCRGLVSDDVNSLDATNDAFDLVHFIAGKRLKRGNLTVIDATNVQPTSRKGLLKLARQHHTLAVAIVLDIPMRLCVDRNEKRADRNFGYRVVKNQHSELKRSMAKLKKEGFRFVYVLKNEKEVSEVEITRTKLWNDRKEETGPFDIIGDVHGCFAELKELLQQLGYKVTKHKDRNKNHGYTVKPPAGRKALFVGDLTDRGSASNEVLRLVMSMVKNGSALCVCGNHDDKLMRKLNGKNVQVRHGLEETMEQLATEPPEFINEAKQFLRSLISHYVLDGGKLVLAHAGLKEDMHGRASKAVRTYCMYGETTGLIDENNLPERIRWEKDYRGKAMVVFGHTPVLEAEWFNNTINIDTGCVFGGKMTALRYPGRELVFVKAKKIYHESFRPLRPSASNGLNDQQQNDGLLHLEDVTGKRIISTRLRPNIMIREENSIAALEVMSRFAINPKWLIYLPPTMSPSETSTLPNYLEYPTEAFEYYRQNGIQKVVCEEKHMGSRACVVIGKNGEAILKTFGIKGEGIGKIYTRTGRAFFQEDNELEQRFLERFRNALTTSGFWEKFKTEWALFDCELMPWSAKAQALLQNQYAAVGAAAKGALPEVAAALKQAKERGIDVAGHLSEIETQVEMANQFTDAYRHYCWPVNSLDDYKLPPFHLLATEGHVFTDKNHEWHIKTIHSICEADKKFLLATPYKVVDLSDEKAVQEATQWWEQLTAKGGEGMVVKPFDFIAKGEKGYVQPAIKCRGSEYLRIIYGPTYSLPDNLNKLKKRSLGRKRSMAMREFALGVEAMERFIKKEPLRRVHECVFGVLAMESEAVDPRL